MIIENRTLEVINLLTSNSHPITLNEFMTNLNLSKRSVYYVISKVNETLEYKKIGRIQFKREVGYFLLEEQKNKLKKIIGVVEDVKRILSPKQRIYYIICILMYPIKPVTIGDISDYCETSRNTTINDIKLARREVEKYNLSLNYINKKGYIIRGSIFEKRAVLLMYIRKLLENFSYHNINFLNEDEVHLYHNRLRKIEKELDTNFEKGTLTSISVFLSIIHKNNERYDFSITELQNISQTAELALVDKYFSDFTIHERLYLTIHLLGYRYGINVKNIDDKNDLKTYEWAEKIVDNFERITAISFIEKDELVNSIYIHLKMSLYLYKFAVQIINPLIDDIKMNYGEIYEVTKKACVGLEDCFGFPILDSEIVSLTAYFGAYLRREAKNYNLINILIVCLNGRATSNLLKDEIDNIYPNVNIVDVITSSKLKEYEDSCDLVISTVELKTNKPYIKVNAILTKEDKMRIVSKIMLMFGREAHNNNEDKVLDIVKKYVSRQDYVKIKEEINQKIYLNKNIPDKIHVQEINMIQLLDTKKIILNLKKLTWQDSIDIVARPLIRQKSITAVYSKSIIKMLETYGQYMIITPGVVLAHGSGSDGVNNLDISVLVSKEPIYFGEKNKINLIFLLAIKDKNSHMRILQDIIQITKDRKNFLDIINASSSQKVLKILKNILK